MKMEKIDRVLVAVKDLDAASKFFSDVLGLTFDGVHADESQDVKYTRTPQGFELIQSTSPDGPVAKFIEKRGEGLYGVIFKPSDMKAAIKEMEGKGLILDQIPRSGETERQRLSHFFPRSLNDITASINSGVQQHML